MEFGFGKPQGALRRALALEDAWSSFEPAATEGVVGVFRGEERQGFGVKGSEVGGSDEGEGVQGPLTLDEQWRQKGFAWSEWRGLGIGGFTEVDERCALGLESLRSEGEGSG